MGGNYDDRAGAITEQHAGSPIVPIQDPRVDFCTDNQRVPGRAVLDHVVGNAERVDKSAADRLYVECRTAARSELGLEDACRRRKYHVGRRRRHDDQIDVGRRDFRPVERLQGRGKRKIAGLLIVCRDAPFANPGPGPYPFVARVDALGQVGVGEYLRGNIPSTSGDPAMHRPPSQPQWRQAPARRPVAVQFARARHAWFPRVLS